MIKTTLLLLTLLGSIFLSITAFAKQVILYDQPNEQANKIATIDLAAGIVPVFAPKNSAWMKVGDPRNGNVGWIKVIELNDAGPSVSYSSSQQIINGKPVPPYQIIQFGAPQNTSTAQQQAAHAAIQKAYQDFMTQTKAIWKDKLPVMPPLVPLQYNNNAVPTPSAPSSNGNVAK